MSKHTKELRDACDSVRRKPYPIADLIPIMQRAADELERMANLNAQMKQEAQIHAQEAYQTNHDTTKTKGAAILTNDNEALRAWFERDFGKSPYYLNLSRFPEKSAWIGQYTELKTQCGWEGYQAGYAAAKAEIAAAVAKERERAATVAVEKGTASE